MGVLVQGLQGPGKIGIKRLTISNLEISTLLAFFSQAHDLETRKKMPNHRRCHHNQLPPTARRRHCRSPPPATARPHRHCRRWRCPNAQGKPLRYGLREAQGTGRELRLKYILSSRCFNFPQGQIGCFCRNNLLIHLHMPGFLKP